MSRLFDCFCYFNEDMLLELRLQTLWDQVDVFVISEASFSHRGQDRDTLFAPERFAKYSSKIRYLKLDRRPPGPNDFWKNENAIRNHLSAGLDDAAPDDRILVSDLDEIPEPSTIARYNPRFLRGDFEQAYYGYFLNNRCYERGQPLRWQGSKITTTQHFREFFGSNATSVRSYKSSGPLRSLKRAWFRQFQVHPIANGGWHFTWVLSMEDIVRKIENTAHQEFNTPELKNPRHIEAMIRAGRDFHKPDTHYVAEPVGPQFPAPLASHPERYAEWLLPPGTA